MMIFCALVAIDILVGQVTALPSVTRVQVTVGPPLNSSFHLAVNRWFNASGFYLLTDNSTYLQEEESGGVYALDLYNIGGDNHYWNIKPSWAETWGTMDYNYPYSRMFNSQSTCFSNPASEECKGYDCADCVAGVSDPEPHWRPYEANIAVIVANASSVTTVSATTVTTVSASTVSASTTNVTNATNATSVTSVSATTVTTVSAATTNVTNATNATSVTTVSATTVTTTLVIVTSDCVVAECFRWEGTPWDSQCLWPGRCAGQYTMRSTCGTCEQRHNGPFCTCV